MADSFGDSRAIYPSSGLVFYIVLLVIVKFFRAFGLFLSYDLLKVIPVVQFLCIIKLGSVLPLVFLQKPFSSGKRITKHQWFRISRHAFVGSAIQILWLFGLTLCGPLRTILLYEHSDLVVIAWATAIFTSNGSGPAKLRGAVFFMVAVIGLLLFDHDDRIHEILEHESVDRHTNIIARLFYHLVDLIGWSDHKGGVILLSITLCLQTGYNNASKKLAIEIGGAKRLHALSTISSIALLFPLSVFVYFTHESEIESWLYMLLPLTIVTLFVFLLDYYIEAVCTNHLQSPRTAKYGSFAIFIGALILSQTWNHPYTASITTMNKLREIITEDHVLSGGVIFSLIAFMVATDILVSPGRAVKGSFIGFSPAGLPLYTFAGDALHRTSTTVMSVLRSGLRQILDDINSRKIFYFLCINLCFTFVELVYGAWTNSLGLISDGFHMLFDCSALVLGLYAAIMSRWKPSRIFPYGYDRVEVLSGFINGLFLIVIAIFVFTEAIDRSFDPPEIKTERLLTVSVIGLVVNLIGIVAFRSSHSHGHGQSHSHGHSHGDPGATSHNTNMQGVFLHILADTLGSVGVIISSLLIENFGWNIADPVCSIFIAVMIFLSVLPLIKETATILMLQMPLQNGKQLNEALEKILNVDGVLAYRDPHIWSHTSIKVLGTLHIQVLPDASEQRVISQATSIFREYGIHSVTVQVEKEAYFHHLTGLSSTFEQIIEYTKNFKALKKEQSTRVKAI